MGGTVSQLEETDWEHADGELFDSDKTVDGKLPTEAYQVYYLLKKAVLANQRDFDVTDDQSNLIYSVRPSAGTIAGFDVLDIYQNHVLRITTDLARRYWIVYRFGVAAYPGQEHDVALTERFLQENLAHQVSQSLTNNRTQEDQQYYLYKMCCITVSWSRYLAVASFYGPPSEEQIEEYKIQMVNLLNPVVEPTDPKSAVSLLPETTGNDDSLFAQASRISDRMKDRSSNSSHHERQRSVTEETDDITNDGDATPMSPHSLADDLDDDEEDNATLPHTLSEPDTLMGILSTTKKEDEGTADSSIPSSRSMPELESRNPSPMIKPSLRNWLRETSESLHSQMKTLQQSSKPKPIDPRLGIVSLEEGPLLLCQEIYNKIIGNHQTTRVSKERVLKLLKQDRRANAEDAAAEASERSELVEASLDLDDTAAASETTDAEESTNDNKSTKQPLVGYWAWENTLRSHKMKLHLARRADLGLHIVMAVIVNQVRYERNALAMTV